VEGRVACIHNRADLGEKVLRRLDEMEAGGARIQHTHRV